MKEVIEYNSAIFDRLPQAELINLFLHAEDEMVLSRFLVDKHLSVLQQFEEIFSQLSVTQQEHWKTSLLIAFSHGMNGVMLSLAANVRLAEVIPKIFKHLSVSDLKTRWEAFSVLGGLASEVDITSQLESFFSDQAYSDSMPMILISLVKANPSKSLRYLLQFLDVSERKEFDTNVVSFIFSAIVRPSDLQQYLDLLNETEQLRVCQFLVDQPGSPYITKNKQLAYRNPEYYPATR